MPKAEYFSTVATGYWPESIMLDNHPWTLKSYTNLFECDNVCITFFSLHQLPFNQIYNYNNHKRKVVRTNNITVIVLLTQYCTQVTLNVTTGSNSSPKTQQEKKGKSEDLYWACFKSLGLGLMH